MDVSVITCDEVTESYDEERKTIWTNLPEKKVTCKIQDFNILLAFLLITIALFIFVGTYCYLIKYRANQKHLLPFHDTELKQFCVGRINWKWVIKLKM